MPLLQWIDRVDKLLLLLIQHDSDHVVLDQVMPVLRDAYTWIPLYAFILYFAWRKAGRNCWSFVVLSLLTFAITDSVTTQLLKPWIGRLRPCHDPDLSLALREVIACGGLYSMPSTHAANHFGLATFWYLSVRTMGGGIASRWWRLLWVWAAAVCYAQVYVGKHFPSDVLVGGVTGCLTGLGTSFIFSSWWHRRGAFGKFILV